MKVLVICYQIERGKGSEAGSGYNFVLNLADGLRGENEGHKITVLTRRNSEVLLRQDHALRGVAVVGYDPPRWVTRLKRGRRGIIGFYYLWQVGAGRAARRLHAGQQFDVVHQYNFHTDWAPHFLRFKDARVVWGPICHQPMLPLRYLELEPWRGPLREVAKALMKRLFWNLDPNLRRSIGASDVVLFANEDVPAVFRASGKVRYQTFGGALPEQMVGDGGSGTPLRLLHVGRSVSIKGAAVALDAVQLALSQGTEVTLTLVGDGPLRSRLVKKAQQLGIAEAVRFLPWLDRTELRDEYARADAFLYPSLGNQDGVVAEALAASLPVIGVSPSGTATMAGEAGSWAPRGHHRRLVEVLARLITELGEEAVHDPPAWQRRRSSAARRSEQLNWPATARAISAAYR